MAVHPPHRQPSDHGSIDTQMLEQSAQVRRQVLDGPTGGRLLRVSIASRIPRHNLRSTFEQGTHGIENAARHAQRMGQRERPAGTRYLVVNLESVDSDACHQVLLRQAEALTC